MNMPFDPNWTAWLLLLAALSGGWLLVRFLERTFPGFVRALPFPRRVILVLRLVRRWLPLLFLIILAWRFLLLAPWIHGALLLLLAIAGFQALQSFFLGWPVRSRLILYPDPWMRCGSVSGKVDRFGLLGVDIVNPEGRHHLDYLRLSREGFSLLPPGGEKNFLACDLHPDPAIAGSDPLRALRDLLALCPWTDWHHPPDIRVSPEPGSPMHLKINLLSGDQAMPFLRLLQEYGFRQSPLLPAEADTDQVPDA